MTRLTRRDLLLTCIGALGSSAAGCGSPDSSAAPIAVAIGIDVTGSARYGLKAFADELRPIFGALATREAPLALLRVGDPAEVHPLKYGKALRRVADAEAALAQTLQPAAQTGSNPVPALEAARLFLTDTSLKRNRKIVLLWSDLINDPTKSAGTVHTFQDPLETICWSGLDSLELHLYGLPADRIPLVIKSWGKQVGVLRTHQIGESFSPEQIRLSVPRGI